MSATVLEQGTIVLYRHPFSEGASGSRSLLIRAAQRHTGLSEALFHPVETNPWGKPFFLNAPQIHFSISHSGAWWICAFAAQPVGVDLQLHHLQADLQILSRRFFHPLEDCWLAQENYIRFFQLWSAKESWVKYMGKGFYLDPGDFSLVSPQGEFPCPPQGQCVFLPAPPDYSLCLCAHSIDKVQILDL